MLERDEQHDPRQANVEICDAIDRTFQQSPFREMLSELGRSARYGDPKPLTPEVKAAAPEATVRDLLHAMDCLARSTVKLEYAQENWKERSVFALYSIFEARHIVASKQPKTVEASVEKSVIAPQPTVATHRHWFIAGLRRVLGKHDAPAPTAPTPVVPVIPAAPTIVPPFVVEVAPSSEQYDVQALESLLCTRCSWTRWSPSDQQENAVVRLFLQSPDLLTTNQLLLALQKERGKECVSETELLRRCVGDTQKIRWFCKLRGLSQDGRERGLKLLASCDGLTTADHLAIMYYPELASDQVHALLRHPQADAPALLQALQYCPQQDLPLLTQAFLALEPDVQQCAKYLSKSRMMDEGVMERFFSFVEKDPQLLEESTPLQDRFNGHCRVDVPGHDVRHALIAMVASRKDPFALQALEAFRGLNVTNDEKFQLYEADPVRALSEGQQAVLPWAESLGEIRNVHEQTRGVIEYIFRRLPALADQILVPAMVGAVTRAATPTTVRDFLMNFLTKNRPEIAKTIVLPAQPSLRDTLGDLRRRGGV